MSDELDPRMVFDRLVVGTGNRLAAAAARRAAEAPGRSYNPRVIHGAPGLGKTHLLRAVAHRAAQVDPELRVHLEGMESLVDRLTASIAAGTLEEFREAIGQVGLLLIDDLQNAAGKVRTQEELLRALDAADAMDAPAEMYHYQPATEHDDGGWKSKTLDAPTFSDQRNLATIFGIMTSKAAELSRASSAAGDAGAISFVETLAAGMQAAAEAMKAAGDDPATDPTIEPTNVSKESLLAEYADAQDDPES